MKYYIVVLLFVQCYGWGNFRYGKDLDSLIRQTNRHYPQLPEQWFTQILDHENPTTSETWQQRYYVNDQFYSPANSNSAFLFIGGEFNFISSWAAGGAWLEYARTYGALAFALEHRYYGESHPTRDMSLENLKYLSSRQALADLANFIVSMNQRYKLSPNTKWIVFGGSYAGNLAAWMRSKYPDLVHGAVASSAPILAEADFSDFFEVVAESLRSHSSECLSVVSTVFREIELLLKRGREGQHILDSKLRLCKPVENYINNPLYISELYSSLANTFAYVVGTNSITKACNILTDKHYITPIDAVASVYKNLISDTCFSYDYDRFIEEIKNTQWHGSIARQWIYQTCTEFGYYQTSSANNSAFGHGFPIEFYVHWCTDAFGKEFDYSHISASVDNTNSFYGGLDIKATRVVFVHGSLDPWHAAGLTHTKDKENPVIYIKGSTHCADMAEREGEVPELKNARKEISRYIGQWLNS